MSLSSSQAYSISLALLGKGTQHTIRCYPGDPPFFYIEVGNFDRVISEQQYEDLRVLAQEHMALTEIRVGDDSLTPKGKLAVVFF